MRLDVYGWSFVALLMVGCLRCVAGQGQDLVNCYQCNVFSKGKQKFCTLTPEELILPNCVSCLKTFTFTSIHDRWSNQDSVVHRFRRGMTYLSKYCLTELDIELAKDDGCYKIDGPNGFTEQCFCRTELCNASTRAIPSLITLFLVSIGLLWKVL